MTIQFQILLFLTALITVYYMIRRIRKSQMKIEDTLYWFFVSVILVLFAIFPHIADGLMNYLGILSSVNFIFLVFIFLLLIKVFLLSITVSKLQYKLDTLIQEYALDRKDLTDKEAQKISQNNAEENEI